ncbi:MAG: hypothetical protein R2779_03195 [Crocinitomicaceae bacterium]
MDDYDIMGAIKVWQTADDKLLADLSKRILDRKLFRVKIAKEPFSQAEINEKKRMLHNK